MTVITNSEGKTLKLGTWYTADLVAALKAAHAAATAEEKAANNVIYEGKPTEATFADWADAADRVDALEELVEFITGKAVVK